VFTQNDILEMELKILTALEFEINLPSSVFFLERYRKIIGLDAGTTEDGKFCKQIAQLSRSFLKYTLQISKFLTVKPSILAVSSTLIAIEHSFNHKSIE
jgi:hypothetical protein